MLLTRLIEEGRSLDLIRLDSQEELTQKIVLPMMPRVADLARESRRLIDRELVGAPPDIRLDSNATHTPSRLKIDYPIGQCAAIRDRGFEMLSLHPDIRTLVSKGVLFKKVYIILKGRYFQNALQLGNVYLDIANDTVERTKPCVEWMPISEVDYINLESLDTIAAVAEGYHRCRVYPNLVFPMLAPMVPLLAVREDGRLDLLDFQNSFFLKDLESGLSRLVSWLSSESEFLRRPLPDAYVGAMARHFGENEFRTFPFEYRPCSPLEITANAREIALAAKRPEQAQMMLTLLRLVPRAKRALYRSDIRCSSMIHLADSQTKGCDS